ncbi:hypothetical protein EWM64_g41 [Hericium alpestre]|uniref:PXA domain-containing protein n=1 Tax=Hericium alpestre TaxID=135208 RepID=A0A4Z0AC29_9AGAM|nr:hypothetical protein EWM64_g41 [Hericium alpestre]
MAFLASRNPPRPPNIHSYSTPSIASSGHSKHAPPSTINQPITLTKRLLFPHLPPTDPIPPLLTSPDAPPAVNAELYDFIALALRAYVNPWWSKITRYDKEFLLEITRILTVVVRALEARVLATDLDPLVFRDLPAVLTEHLVDYRAATQKLDTSYALGGSCSLPALFHARQQHIGVTAEGQLDEVYLRTAIDAVLKACLPEEDWEPDPERYIIREVILKVVCQDVVPKITQPWFVYKAVLDLLGPAEASAKPLKVESSTVIEDFVLVESSCIIPDCLFVSITSVPAPSNDDHRRFASSAIATISEMLVSAFRPFLDRLLPHFLYTHVLTPSTLTHTVSTAKRTLFPNGYPAPAPPDPIPEEQLAIRAALAARVAQLIPNFLSPFILGPTPAASAATLDVLLDPFSSQACNAHLVLLILDLFLGTLFPELLPPKPVPSPATAEVDVEQEDDLIGRGISITPPGSMPP